jgi:hypothetical protein
MAGSVRFAALIAPFHEYKDVKPGPAGLPLVGSLGLVFLLRFVVRAGSVRRFLNMRRNPSIDNARAPVASMPRRRCNVSIRAQVISSSVSARTRISPSLHSTRSRRSSSSPAQRATAAPAADQPPAAQPIFRSAARQSPGSPRLPCVRSFLPVRSASPRRSALRRSRSRCHSRLFSAFSPGTRTTRSASGSDRAYRHRTTASASASSRSVFARFARRSTCRLTGSITTASISRATSARSNQNPSRPAS